MKRTFGKIGISLLLAVCLVIPMTIHGYAETLLPVSYNSAGRGTLTFSGTDVYGTTQLGSVFYYLSDNGNGRLSGYFNIGGNALNIEDYYVTVYSYKIGDHTSDAQVWIEPTTFNTATILFPVDTARFLHIDGVYMPDASSVCHYLSPYEVLWSSMSGTEGHTIVSAIHHNISYRTSRYTFASP